MSNNFPLMGIAIAQHRFVPNDIVIALNGGRVIGWWHHRNSTWTYISVEDAESDGFLLSPEQHTAFLAFIERGKTDEDSRMISSPDRG